MTRPGSGELPEKPTEPVDVTPETPEVPAPEPEEDPLTYAERALALRRQEAQEAVDAAQAEYADLKQRYLVAVETLKQKRAELEKIDSVLDYAREMPEFQPVADPEVESLLDWIATVDPEKAAQADVLFRRINEQGKRPPREDVDPGTPTRPVRPDRDQ